MFKSNGISAVARTQLITALSVGAVLAAAGGAYAVQVTVLAPETAVEAPAAGTSTEVTEVRVPPKTEPAVDDATPTPTPTAPETESESEHGPETETEVENEHGPETETEVENEHGPETEVEDEAEHSGKSEAEDEEGIDG
jgi:hypothetical protein